MADEAVFNYLSNIIYFMNKLTNYLKASIEEMKKVTWPTKKETYRYTVLVIGVSAGVAIFLGLLDLIFNFGIQSLINKI